jgi:PAS domain S-box-containing protein
MEDLQKKVNQLELQIRSLKDAAKGLPGEGGYQKLLENLPVGVIIFTPNFKVLYINDLVSKFLGVGKAGINSKLDLNIFNYVLPQYHEQVKIRREALAQGNNQDFFELKIKLPNKDIANLQVKSSIIEFNGEPAVQTLFLDVTKNRKIEEQMRESDKQLSMILNTIDELVYYIEFNPDGTNKTIKYLSSQMERILGVSPQQYITETEKLLEFCHPEDRARLIELSERIKKEKKTQIIVYRFKHQLSGEYIWLEERVFPQLNEMGEHIGNLGITRNVTDRVNYESKLKESEQSLSLVLNSVGEIVYYLDFSEKEPKVKFVGDNIEDILGFTKAEFSMSSGSMLRYVHPDDVSSVKETVDRLLQERKPQTFYYRFKHKRKQEYIWIEERVFPKYDERGRHVANFGITRDITEIKEAELSLKRNEERFRMLAENAQDIVFKFAFFPVGHYEYVSPSVFELTGYTPEEFYTDPYLGFRMIHKDDLYLLGESERILKEGLRIADVKNPDIILRWIRKDGSIVWTETRNKPVFDEKGKLIAIEGISRDITQTKRDEEALRDSEERFRILSQAAMEGIVLSDRGAIIDVNDRFLDIFGYKKPEEILGKFIRDFIIRDSKNFVSNRISSDGHFSSFEIVCSKKDGTEIFIEARGQNIPYNGKKIRITAINDITQRKLAENALKESERTLSTLLGNLPGMAFRCAYDDKWTMQFVSNGCFELTGYTPDALLSNPSLSFSDLVHPEDLGNGRKMISEAIQNRTQFEIQYRIICADNKVKWVWEKGEGVFDEKGNLLFLEGFISDITDRKQHEIELEKSKESYKNLIESSPDGIFIHDKKGNVFFANPSILKMLGVNSFEEFGTKSIFDYSLPEDIALYRKRKRDLLAGKDMPFIETKIRRPDGGILEIESKPILFNYLGQPSVLIFCRDITFQRQLEKEQLRAQMAEETNKKLQLEIEQRQRTERQLEATQKYTRRLIDSSLDMICASDKEGFITEFNLAAQRSFGYKPSEVIGKSVGILYANPQQRHDVNDELTLGSGSFAGEVINRKKNGKNFTAFLSASVLRNESGEIIGAMGVSRDITEIKKTEEQITLQAAKLNSIIETTSHYIWTFNKQLKLTSFNKNYALMMHRRYQADVKTGTNLFKGKFVSTTEHNDFWMMKSLAAFQGRPQHFETSFYHEDTGTTSWMEVFLNPIYGVDSTVNEISGIGHDITEKKVSEEKLRQSLKEKEVLLKEVHHRVKNNLQVISSILNLQSSYVKDKKTLEILRESQNRIKSMAFIHESLYQTRDFSSINFTEYVTNLSKNLVHSYQSFEDQVQLDLNIQEVYLNLDIAIPCGLIINEILSNALKYAFPNNRKGTISIRLAHKNQNITLIIHDNGVGLPAHIDYKNTESLGLQLVVTLVDQLGGTIKLDRSKGTKFTIVFINPIKNA